MNIYLVKQASGNDIWAAVYVPYSPNQFLEWDFFATSYNKIALVSINDISTYMIVFRSLMQYFITFRLIGSIVIFKSFFYATIENMADVRLVLSLILAHCMCTVA